MDRRLLLLVAAMVVVLAGDARADRLGGNFRGPGDACRVREDAPTPAAVRARRDPLLASLGLERPFVCGVGRGQREAEFRGRPLLVLFVLPGSKECAALAHGAFGDAEVLDLASRFAPAVANAEREEAFGVAHRVRVFPTVLLLDAAGRETGRVEGAVGPARVAAALREGLEKAGAARPSPEARALEREASRLARARRAKDWKGLLAAAAAIEQIGHDGPERDLARVAVREASDEATARIEEARRDLGAGEREDGRRLLLRVAREFAGLEESAEAADLLRGLEGVRTQLQGLAAQARPAFTTAPSSRDPRFEPKTEATPQPLLPIPIPEPPPGDPTEPPPPPPPPPDPDP